MLSCASMKAWFLLVCYLGHWLSLRCILRTYMTTGLQKRIDSILNAGCGWQQLARVIGQIGPVVSL